MSEWMTTADVGRLLGLAPDTIRKLADRGRLPVGIKTRNGWRLFRRADVDQFQRDREALTTGPQSSPPLKRER